MSRIIRPLKWFYHEFGLVSIHDTGRDAYFIVFARAARMFAFGTNSLILAIFLSALGYSDHLVGIFMSLTMLGDLFLGTLLTLVADRIGRRKVLLGGSALMVASGLVFVFLESFWVLLFAAVVGVISVTGGDYGPFRSIEQSVISQLTTSSTRADVLSWYVVFASLGSALGSEASGRMVHALSHRDGWTEVDAYHALFWLHTSVGALNAILVLGLSDACELRTEKTYAQLAQDEANQPTPQSTPTDTPNWKSKANSWFSSAAISAQTRSIMYRLWFLLSIDSLADGMVPYSLTNYYMDLKFHPSKSTLGDITSASYFLGAISSTFAGPLAKRIGLINTMVFTHVPSSAAVLLFPLPPVFWLTTFLLLIRTGLNPMDQAPRAAFIAAVVRPEERTACMGITTMVRISAAMLGPSITGGLAATNKFWIAYAVAGTCRLAYDFGLWALFVNMKIDQGEVKGDAGLGVVEGTELDEEENLELHSLPDFASSDNLDFEHRLAAKDNRGQNDG